MTNTVRGAVPSGGGGAAIVFRGFRWWGRGWWCWRAGRALRRHRPRGLPVRSRSTWTPTGSYTPIEDVSEIHIDDLFRVQAFFQQHWADNAVSFTANIDPDTKAEELSSVLGKWLEHLKGTTVFPDLSRPQSPYERIDATTFEELTAGSAVETGQDFDECANGACPVR